MQLETDSHTLTLFKGTNRSEAPYFTLLQKRCPESATPQPLDSGCELETITSGDGKLVHISLGGSSMGDISSEKGLDDLASFVSEWRRALSELDHHDHSVELPEILDLLPEPDHKPENVSTSDVRDQNLIAQRDQFLTAETLSIRMITWNVHGESISGEDFRELFGMGAHNWRSESKGIVTQLSITPETVASDDQKMPGSHMTISEEVESFETGQMDMYVLCLQESDTLGRNFYANTGTLEKSKLALLRQLGQEYVEVAHNQLLGLMTIVVARRELAEVQISNVRLSSTGTGLFGVWGNKGAISVRFTVGADKVVPDTGVELVIVNCHLSAGGGQEGVDRRRWELGEISSKFGIGEVVNNDSVIFDSDAHELSLSEDILQLEDAKPPVEEFAVFVLGDLNYRVATLDSDMVKDFVRRRDYETILLNDELTLEMKSRRVLQGFKEGRVRFPPTYKYSSGDVYDPDRVPSYTDRVLYSGDGITQVDYSCHPSYVISDHKPVSSTMLVKIELVDYEKRNEITKQILKKLDQLENASRPVVHVEPLDINQAGLVLHEQRAWITLKQQEGGSLVEWEVVMEDERIQASPLTGTLPAGATQKIRLSTTLGIQQKQVKQIVIVRIIGVQDIFISVEFNALPTCLGASLDLLCRMPNGARAGIKDVSSANMPREIWNCVDYLWSHVVPDMFWRSGDDAIQQQVQEWMDQGQELDVEVLETANSLQDNVGTYSVARQFLLLLQNISGGVLPVEYYYLVLRGKDGVHQVLESIPGVNVNVLLYIAGFLNRLIDQGVDQSRLLSLFEPLLVSIPRGKDSSKARRARAQFLAELGHQS
jgi:hypothetical protein